MAGATVPPQLAPRWPRTNGWLIARPTPRSRTAGSVNAQAIPACRHYVQIESGAQYCSLLFNNFERSFGGSSASTGTASSVVQVLPAALVPGFHTIAFNSFQDFAGSGGDNGNEPIRLGDGAYSLYVSRTVVEYNVFSNTYMGDAETVSVKSRGNVIRYNTHLRNPGATFCFRNGDFGVAYGNVVLGGSGGFRVKVRGSMRGRPERAAGQSRGALALQR